MIRARIIGTGHHLPEKVWTNDDLTKFMDTTDEWIRQRTGIEKRHVAAVGEATSDLGAEAAKKAMEMAGVTADEIDLVVCATITADYIIPASGNLIQHKIGAKRAGGCDINAACSGFVYGLATCDAFIRAGTFKTILLVGGEVVSNRLNYEARDTAVLFGDGAGAVVLRADTGGSGVLSSYLRSDGGEFETLFMPAGGSKQPLTVDNLKGPSFTVQMKGPELFKRAVIEFGDAINQALAQSGIPADQVDYFIPHQANLRIIQAAAQRAGWPDNKIIVNIQRVGNTTAGSIPIAMDEAVRDGRIKQGSMLLLASFGAGLTWGSSMVRY
jgi:3-oxoacyl-[acyl-carrier-protein] synthase-3